MVPHLSFKINDEVTEEMVENTLYRREKSEKNCEAILVNAVIN
jgi:hypothetical protein